MATGAVIARIISQYSDKGSKAAQKDIAKLGKQIDSWSRRVVKSYAIAGAAVAAFAVKLGTDAVQGAMEDQKQQASLALALKNTTDATDAAIAANAKYLDSLELQVAIDNNQLIPALQRLVLATGNLGEAQALLSLATDVSALSGRDLATVSVALSRAVGGNLTALKRLNVPLDENALKTGNLKKLFEELAKVSAGQAAAAADTFAGRMERLRLTFAQVADRVGYALMPAIEEFATYLISDVIPNIEEWIILNETKLRDSFKGTLDTLFALSVNIVKVIGFLEKYKEILLFIVGIPLFQVFSSQVMIILGLGRMVANGLKAIPTASGAVVKGFRGVATAVGLVTAAFRAGGFLAALKGAVQIFMMLNPYVRIATGLFALGAGAVALFTRALGKSETAAKSATISNDKIEKQRKEAILDGFKSIEVATAAANAEKARTFETLKNLEAQRKAEAAARRRAKFEADYAKLNATLAKRAGVQLLSSEDAQLVQINAAIALANRQKEINKLDKERLERMKEELTSMKVRNDLAARYQDILKALADAKIDTKEIAILAKMWGVPTEAVEAYLATIFAVEDAKISDDEIVNLAMKWGSTQAQAAQYLDFFQALNDGYLSDAEINKLMSKWKMTQNEVLMYADFVGIVNDGVLEDDEIIKIREKWKLTNDQVVDYIKKIGAPVSYSGTLIDPAKAAEIAWLNATAALQRYLDLLKKGTGVVVTPTTPTTPTVPNLPIVPPSHDPKIISDAAAIAAKTAEQIATLTELRKDTTPGTGINFLLKEHIDALKDNTSTFSNLPVVDEQTKMAAMRAQSAASIPATFDVGSFRQAEEASMAGLPAIPSFNDYDERFRFNRGTVATAQGISGGNLMAAPINVTVNVAGSVTAEQDLVQTVRNGLLATQYNGNQLLLEAI